MEIINLFIYIFGLIKLWQYSFLTIFVVIFGLHVLEYIAYNGNSIKNRLLNTQSFPKKIIYGLSYGINLCLVNIGVCKDYMINNIISTRIGNYLYCQLSKFNLKFLELKTRFFHFIINNLLKTILSMFDNEKERKQEMKKIEEKKKSKKVLDTDEEINRFLNEILETIKD